MFPHPIINKLGRLTGEWVGEWACLCVGGYVSGDLRLGGGWMTKSLICVHSINNLCPLHHSSVSTPPLIYIHSRPMTAPSNYYFNCVPIYFIELVSIIELFNFKAKRHDIHMMHRPILFFLSYRLINLDQT